jgi:hypothetical protein
MRIERRLLTVIGIAIVGATAGPITAAQAQCFDLAITIPGTAGADVLTGSNNVRDVIDGDAGNDALLGLGANDSLCGGADMDSLFGGGGNDRLDGGPGDDPNLNGDDGNDRIFGNAGMDTLRGDDHADALFGGMQTPSLEAPAMTLCTVETATID